MSAELAGQIWVIVGIYAGIGVIVAMLFVTVLIKRVSAGARTAAPLQFRVLIFPACIALWPLLLLKSLAPAAKEEVHDETSA